MSLQGGALEYPWRGMQPTLDLLLLLVVRGPSQPDVNASP